MTEPRCDLSELLISQCAHCKDGAKSLDDSVHEKEAPDIKEIIAKYNGVCACGVRFKKGDIIGWSKGDQWWRARNCCEEIFV